MALSGLYCFETAEEWLDLIVSTVDNVELVRHTPFHQQLIIQGKITFNIWNKKRVKSNRCTSFNWQLQDSMYKKGADLGTLRREFQGALADIRRGKYE